MAIILRNGIRVLGMTSSVFQQWNSYTTMEVETQANVVDVFFFFVIILSIHSKK